MVLNSRPAHVEDLKECLPLIQDLVYFKPVQRPRLLSFWRYLLKNRAAQSLIIENRQYPLGGRILFFGLSVFMTDEFVQEAKTALAPPLSLRLLEKWLEGHRGFLNHKEIARDNSGDGLNLLTLQLGWKDLPPAELVQVNAKMMEGFFYCHSGYQIKERLVNIHGYEKMRLVASHDTRLRRDYKELSLPFPPDSPSYPFLMGVHRDEYQKPQSFYSIFNLFHAPRPRFGFSSGEKDVLERALLGETDQEISRSLHLSLWAIKKRWQGIYEKVERLDPQLLVPQSNRPMDPPESPKAERRRYFLEYLREHLEEIRPTLGLRRKKTILAQNKKAPVV